MFAAACLRHRLTLRILESSSASSTQGGASILAAALAAASAAAAQDGHVIAAPARAAASGQQQRQQQQQLSGRKASAPSADSGGSSSSSIGSGAGLRRPAAAATAQLVARASRLGPKPAADSLPGLKCGCVIQPRSMFVCVSLQPLWFRMVPWLKSVAPHHHRPAVSEPRVEFFIIQIEEPLSLPAGGRAASPAETTGASCNVPICTISSFQC